MSDIDIKLAEDRKEIDRLDREILALLNNRAQLSIHIAKIKSEKKLPVFAPERENDMLAKIIKQNAGPFDSEAIRHIFMTIINESKRLQHSVILNSDEEDIHSDE